MDINQYCEDEFPQPSQAEEMPTPVKAFTKIHGNRQTVFFCLNKERYLLFSQHHCSTAVVFMMFYDILCDYVDDDVLFVSLTAFDVFFYRPLAAVFLEVDLPSNRAGNEDGQAKCRTFAPHI